MNFLRKILFPFVPIYWLVTWFRNKFYDVGIKNATSFNIPVICVGNLSTGGTGKTPMIEYLIRLLRNEYKIATLSRGYKRKTSGFLIADKNVSAEAIGDEPFQFYRKFGSTIQVAVDGDRVNGVSQLLKQETPPEIVLLDDAYQHRKIKAGFNIMLTTYNNPFCKDIVLPTGNLREPRNGYKRADIIIVTKCPYNLTEKEKDSILKRIKPKKNQNVFFSTIAYSENVLSQNEKINLETFNDFTLVTGIANASTLIEYLKSKNLSFEHLNFKDHHEFSTTDIANLNLKSKILTTEKDFVRLRQYKTLKDKLFYLPIKVSILNHEKFDELLRSFIKSN